MLKEINEDSFKKEVLENNIPIIVDMYASWCSPCHMIVPILEKLQKEYEGKIEIVKVNIDNNNALAEQYGVLSIPTLIVFKNGKQFEKIIGAQGEMRFKNLIEAAIVSQS